jgi:hypothetical protein
VAETPTQKAEAFEVIIDSLEQGKQYSLIIKTQYSEEKVLGLFKSFDE